MTELYVDLQMLIGSDSAIDEVNEFISSPKIRAINVSVHPKAICVLYEELE